MSKKKRKKKSRSNAVFYFTVLLFIVFVVSAVMFFTQTAKAKREQKAFENLAEIEIDYTTDDSADVTVEKPMEKSRYDKLYELNSDYVGWLNIPNTNIDYPVMYTPSDAEYYIHRAFDKSESDSGTPFIGEGGSLSSDCFIIYGHNMKNKTMFATLYKYTDESFWQRNKSFTLETSEGAVKYEIFAAVKTEVLRTDETGFRYYNASGTLTEDEYMELTDWLDDNSLYYTGITPTYGEQIVILSTCGTQSNSSRFIVAARRI